MDGSDGVVEIINAFVADFLRNCAKNRAKQMRLVKLTPSIFEPQGRKDAGKCFASLCLCGSIFIILIGSFGLNIATAQARYGNEWIRYNQPYLKITIAENGIYRLSFAQLTQTGFPTTDPVRFQLFHRGTEIALRVGSDFVEFYAEANDGAQDSLLYRPRSARPHAHYSLFSENTAYFLTVGTSNGLRIPQLSPAAFGITPETYHLEQQLRLFNDEFSFNNSTGPVPFLQQSFYEQGEGRTGKWIRRDSTAIWNVSLTNWVRNALRPKLELMLNGRTEFFHQISASVGVSPRTFAQVDFFGFLPKIINTDLSDSDLTPDGRVQFSLRAASRDPFEIYSLTYHKLTYPQSFDMTGLTQKVFYLRANAAETSLVRIPNAPTDAQVWDITQRATPRLLATTREGNTLSVIVPETAQARKLWVTNTLKTPVSVTTVRFENIDNKTANYLILTHPRLRESANAYAQYRQSVAGGSYRVKVFDIQDVYEQFGYGERHPVAVRRWADWMLSGGQRPYLLLLGRGISFPELLRNNPDDLLPSWGYPASDILFTQGLANEAPEVPAMPTGRLSVTRNEEALVYLQKVREFEANAPNELWRKRILHLSGGKSESEISDLRNVLDNLSTLPNRRWIGARTAALSKQSPVEVENVNISPQLNDGVGLITFFGHASPNVTDLNIGFASTAGNGLNNQPRYPFMYFNGCGVGNVFLRQTTLTTDWLFTPNRGAIGVLAHSFWSYSGTTQTHLDVLYRTLFNDRQQIGASIGQVQQEANRRLSKQAENDFFMLANIHQSVLQGDPALVIYPQTKPDFGIEKTGVFVQSKNQVTPLSRADSVQVGAIVSNLGLYDSLTNLRVRAKVTFRNGRTVERAVLVKSVAFQDTILVAFAKETDLQRIEVMADADQSIAEISETNNTASLDIDWTKAASLVAYPLDILPDRLPPVIEAFFDQKRLKNDDFVRNTPEVTVFLRDENTLIATDTTLMEIFWKRCEKCNFERLNYRNITLANRATNELAATLRVGTLAAGKYTLLVTGCDANKNTSQPYQIQFQVAAQPQPTEARLYPNPASWYAKLELLVQAPTAPQRVLWTVYDLMGRVLHTHEQPASVGTNELFWQPNPATPNGSYVYKATVEWPDGTQEHFNGRLVLLRP
jgi:hypothetical protein